MSFRCVVRYLAIGVVSLGLSLAVFEGVLFIAIPGHEDSSASPAANAPPQEQERPIGDQQSPSPSKQPASKRQQRSTRLAVKPAACHSDYYAVFDTASGPACVRNPTNLVAHWGPPSPSWFRTLGGQFRADSDDRASSKACACLSAQSAYQHTTGLAPIRHIIYNDQKRTISKWVCADSCAVATDVK